MTQALADRLRRTILVSMVLSAIGIAIQIFGGWPYPTVPPGLLITLAGGFIALIPFRWAPILTLLVGIFILFGYVTVGDFGNMFGSENAAVTSGKWLQFGTILVGTAAAIASLVRPPHTSRVPTGSRP